MRNHSVRKLRLNGEGFIAMKDKSVRCVVITAIVAAALQHASPLHAQKPDISASPGTHVSSDSPKTPFYEPFLAINPRDAKNLLVTSSVGVEGSFLSYLYVSRDGGNTWQRVKPVPNPIAGGGDAVVYFGLCAGIWITLRLT